MKNFILFSLFGLAGCRGLTDNLGFTHHDYTGASCDQAYQQKAYAENRTAQAQNVIFAYADPTDEGRRKTVSASIPAGGTFDQKLRDYTVTVPGSQGDDYSINAYCDPAPKTSVVDLSLSSGSFNQVKDCQVGGGSGLVFLIDLSATCPEYTTQQGAAL